MFQFVSDFFRLKPKELARAAVLGPLNGFFIIGDMLDSMVRAIIGMKDWPDEVPIYGPVNDLVKAMKNVTSGDMSSEDIWKAMEDLGGAIGGVTGIPIEQPIRTVEGGVDLLSGAYEKGIAKILGWSPFVLTETGAKKKKSGIRTLDPAIKIDIKVKIKPKIKIPKIKI